MPDERRVLTKLTIRLTTKLVRGIMRFQEQHLNHPSVYLSVCSLCVCVYVVSVDVYIVKDCSVCMYAHVISIDSSCIYVRTVYKLTSNDYVCML